jgi:ubiquinone/menaquinone biosynthesis C-methylase UbiE
MIQIALKIIPKLLSFRKEFSPNPIITEELVFGVPPVMLQTKKNHGQDTIEEAPNPDRVPLEERIWPHKSKTSLKQLPTEASPFTTSLLRWANALPASPSGIIDLAAGQGIEAFFLNQAGFKCFAVDASQLMISHSFVPDMARLGNAFKLAEPNDTYGGVLLKDALIFFSPPQRILLFEEAYRILIPGGRIIIISEEISTFAQVYSPDTGVTSNYWMNSSKPSMFTKNKSNYESWLNAIYSAEANGAIVDSVEWGTDLGDTVLLAENKGFRTVSAIRYNSDDPQLQGSVWTSHPYFILELQKD